ncbi:hypothetical protein BHE90_000561 [Fusarium euwallaceae]|uniref:Uncharacterized protein n=1 Tax=Fusarium euwallaceae TaxID=1147111 RepID=A0A430MA65_9HYPO|nr:hypothetical protein BHE90_000561 [Fusarium euwallaceae]
MNWIEQGPVFDITEDELLEAVNMHKRFRMPLVAPRVVLTDLPNFDDITQYGVSEEIQQHLWSNEIARLLGAITSPEALAFKGSKALAIGSKSSYEMLAAMADHVWEALNIAAYDGEGLLATDVKELCKVDLLKSSRLVLVYLCGKEEDDDAPGIEDLFNFVDYLTAVLAQILCDAAEGKLFHLHILAQLVKLSAKIKTVSRRLQACAQISIEKGISDRKIDELDTEPLPEGMRGLQGELASLDSSSKKDSMRSVYYLQCAKYRHGIFDLLRFVLVPLRRTDKLTSNSATPYELCSAVYGMRFERFRTLVYQDHENDFSGTSDASTINCARGSFRRLWAAVLHVRRFGSTYCQPPFTTTRDSSGTHSQSESIAIDHHDSNKMKTWILEEKGVMVRLAKNVRVQNWPWNDFLHGRVLCKSISELSSVTGVNEQLILAKLLQDESISVLQTRGPYNKVFNRKSEDGFSIDRPLSTWAMLLGGLIMIVVEFERETGLVCLDLRRGTKCGLIQNMCVYESEGGEFIHCPRLPNEQDEEAYEGANRIRLEKGNLVWLRTLGFYGNKKAVFI